MNSKAISKSFFNSVINLYHQMADEKNARAILKRVEAVKGPLAKSIAKRCDDYAVEVLGRKYYSPWLYVYSAIFGTFEEGWIPKNFYEGVLHEKICGRDYMGAAALNALNGAIFRSDCFPDLAAYANGSFFSANYQHVAPEKIEDILFRENEKVVFKLDGSHDGLGIFILDRASFNLDRIREFGNGIFQGFINQHELLNTFARSVATLRLTTCMDDQGAVTPRACHLRLGTGADTHVQTSTQIRVPIKLESGRFFDFGYSSDWLEIDAHPTSGEAFSGKAIPSFQACVDLVVELHRKVPFVRCVGWDVAVDATGQPRVMEWNIGYNGVGFDQASQGPCFADLHWERYRPRGRDRLFF